MLVNLLLGVCLFFITMSIQVVVAVMMIRYLIKVMNKPNEVINSFRFDTFVISMVLVILFVGHLGQIAIWAALFMYLGEFNDFLTAFYHSTVNFASLGYGDIVMSEKWRLLGGLEASNGVLLFGLSAGTMLAVMNNLFRVIGLRACSNKTTATKWNWAKCRGKLHKLVVAGAICLLSACTIVGPDFVKPEVELPASWAAEGNLSATPIEQPQWWKVFNDSLLNSLVETAWRQNNSLEIAGLRVLEARAQLGIAQGNLYPQSQLASGSGIYTSPANNLSNAGNYWQYGVAASASWEIDFWGRFARAIESADAAYLASLAARDQIVILLTAQVVNTYSVMRINEEQLRIANDNVKLQQRSFDIAKVLYEQGSDSELDMQQANTLLLSTEATIPGYVVAIRQAKNALSTLLGKPPGSLDNLLQDSHGIPVIPTHIAVGIPADLLRRRPDVRQAELNAMAQNAQVGFAEANMYPSFSLTGSLGLAAGGPGGTDLTDLFSADAFTFSVGPQFIWPFLNYGRIRNSVRVQDARLQAALVNYQEVVLQSAREVEDSMLALQGAQTQADILDKTVVSAKRSNQLSVLRYREGFSDYQRVLDSQQSLFSQQQRLVTQRGAAVLNLVSLYQSLGGGWEAFSTQPLISEQSREEMQNRTNWGDLLNEVAPASKNSVTAGQVEKPDNTQ